MLTTIEGVFRDGQIELRELPKNIQEARVIVTFLDEAESTSVEPARGRTPGEPPSGEPEQGRTWGEHLLQDDHIGGSSQRLAPEAPATPEQRVRAFQALVASLPEVPALPLTAFDRENLYS